MTDRNGKTDGKKKRPVTHTLAIVIVVLAIVVAAVIGGSLYITRYQQETGETFAPVAKLKELVGMEKTAAPAPASDRAESVSQAEAAEPEAQQPEDTDGAENTPEETVEAEEEPGDLGEPAHDEGIVTYKEKQYRYNDHLSNYLMLGIDTSGDLQEEKQTVYAGQSDAMYLVLYDRREETVRILAIPRDTMTDRKAHV